MYVDKLQKASPKMTFKQWLECYNTNLDLIRNFLITIGDKYYVETFTGSSSKTINLEHKYLNNTNSLMVYCNGSIQWIGENYKETSESSIELLFDRLETDEIKVMITQSNLLQTSIEEYINQIEDLCNKSKESLGTANSLYSRLMLKSEELDRTLNRFLESQFSVEDMLIQISDYHSELTGMYRSALIMQNTMTVLSEKTENNSLAAQGYLEEIKELKEAIERLSVLELDNISDREILDARGGYATLGDRLNHYSYTFNNATEMIASQRLKDQDICFSFGGDEINDGKQAVYRVVELESPDSIAAEKYYELTAKTSDPNKKLYAYQIGGFGTGSGTGGGTADGIQFQVQNLEETTYLELGDKLQIKFLYKSGILAGTFYYSTDGYSYIAVPVDGPGYHTVEIGPYNVQSSFNLRLYMMDADGNMSDTLSYNIKVGDLAANLLTTITDYQDTDNISIRWRINDIYGLPITSHLEIYNKGEIYKSYEIEDSKTGVNNLALGSIPAGQYHLKLWLTNDDTQSKLVEFTFNVSSLSEIATYIVDETHNYLDTDDILVKFGLLYAGSGRFTTDCYLDGDLITSLDTVVGDNNLWNISGTPAGSHDIRLVTRSSDNKLSCELLTYLVIEETIKSDISIVSDNLLIDLDSRYKNNSDILNRDKWGDKGTIYNSDHKNSGFVMKHVDNDSSVAVVLAMNGYDMYMNYDMCPFFIEDLDLVTGMTFEMKYKAYDLGDKDAVVAECLDENDKGFIVYNNRVLFNPFGSVHSSDALSRNLNTDTWHKISLITVKGITSTDENEYGYYTKNDLAIIAIDGMISGLISGDIDSSYYMSERNPMYFGAHYNRELHSTEHHSKCDIQHIRVYSDNLQPIDILNNYIADIHDADKKAKLQVLNDYKTGIPGTADQLSLPSMVISGGDLAKLDEIEGLSAKDYIFPNLDIRFIDPSGRYNMLDMFGASLKVQGTSSLNYKIKNYKITAYNYAEHQDTKSIVLDKTTGKPLTDGQLSNTGMYESSNIKKLGDKLRVQPADHWRPEHTFTLKADYMESSHAHNIGTAKYLESYFATNLPPQQADLSNPYYESGAYKDIRSAIDGFPMVVIYQDLEGNTINKGIYCFDIDKNASKVFGYDEYEDLDCLSYELANNESGGAAGFNIDSSTSEGRDSIRKDFEIRFHPFEEDGALGDDDFLNLDSGYHDALLNVIDWTCSCKDNPERFKAEVSKHWDIPTLIDYYLLVRFLGMADNLGKNTMITTWNGKSENIVRDASGKIDWEKSTFAIWYPQFYDMDTMLGLNNTGYNVYDTYHDIQGNELDPTTYNTPDSALWTNLEKCFASEIAARYATLRNNKKLSVEAFTDIYFGEVIDKIGHYYYNRDALAKYFGLPQYYYMCQGSRRAHIERWLTNRLMFMDSIYSYGTSNIIFRNYKRADQTSANINFGIKVRTPQYITVQYTDNDTETKLCNNDRYTFFSKQITGSDSNIIISSKPSITELTGLSFCNIESIDLSNAYSLMHLDLADCRYLNNLVVGNNHWLQKIDLSNTSALAINLDVSTLKELIEIKAKNSALLSLGLSSSLGSVNNLKKIDLNGTVITELNCKNLNTIESIGTVNISTYSNYAQMLTDLETWRISDENLNKLLINMKQLLISNEIVENATIIADMDLEDIFDNYSSSFGEMYIPGLIKMSPGAKMHTINFSYLDQINAVSIIPLISAYMIGSTSMDLGFMDNLAYLSMSHSDSSNLSLSENINLEYVKLVSFSNIKQLDLSDAYKLVHLIVQSANLLESVYLHNTMNTLKTLDVSYCLKLTAFRYDKDATNVGLDLDRFNLTSINFSSATSIPSITNIHAVVPSLANVFYIDWRYTSDALKTLTGRIEVTGNGLSQAFWGQRGLTFNLGKGLDLIVANTTNAYRAFLNCLKFSYSDLIYLMKQLSKCNNFNYAFSSTGISCNSLPADLFQCGQGSSFKSPATNLSNMLSNCSGMKNVVLPTGIFDSLVNVSDLSNWMTYGSVSVPNYSVDSSNGAIYEGTTSLAKSCIGGTVPDTLFSKMTNLKYLDNFFTGSTITIANLNLLFNNCSNLIRLDNVFAGATLNLTNKLSKDFFKNLTKVTSIKGIFRGSNLGGGIPDELFNPMTSLVDASYAFCGCRSVTGINNGNFMRANSKLNNLQFMLANTSLKTTLNKTILPIDDGSVTSRNLSGLFYLCDQLGTASNDYPEYNDLPHDFFEGQYNVTSIAYIFGKCSNLVIRLDDTDDEGNHYYRFKDLRSLVDASGIFYYCSNLVGELPDYGYVESLSEFYIKDRITGEYIYTPLTDQIPGLFSIFDADGNAINAPIERMRAVFYMCRKLEGIIPGNLFTKLSKVTTLAYAFYRCTSIGTKNMRELSDRHLPYGLLDSCVSLVDASYLFAQATYVGKSKAEVDDPIYYNVMYDEVYFIPRYFFYYCPKLTNLAGAFQVLWTDQTVDEADKVYYECHRYGSIYPYMFSNNPLLSNLSSFLAYNYDITGYETANYTNGIDYHLLYNNPLIQNLNSAFYSTAVGNVELGIIQRMNQIAIFTDVANLVSPGLLTRTVNNKYVGRQLIYDLETNSYISFYEAYGIYANSAYGF